MNIYAMNDSIDYIELNRQFVELGTDNVAQEGIDPQIAWNNPPLPAWSDILDQHRVVLLSSAGTGKTWEIRHQCNRLRKDSKAAFFLRLEYLAEGLTDIVFEDGDMESFLDALSNDDEMWIFLDSIDEARLDGPAAFDQALRHLHHRIKNNLQNTHIILTSRVGAWRPRDDATRVDRLFPYSKPQQAAPDPTQDSDGDPGLTIPESNTGRRSPIAYYTLRPLTSEQMQTYADARGISDAAALISEIECNDLRSLAGRPKDLDDIIAFWCKEGRLGKRRDLVEANIERKLKENDLDRSERVALTSTRAREGAKKLAATVVLTHQTKITVPDQGSNHGDGFVASEALEDWTDAMCSALLQRPIFEPETYGFVRFDHRDSREFLAAQWFHDLIQHHGQSRQVETLFFKTQYNEEIVIPSLRPILPWLALLDAPIRHRLLRNWPEILLEGGDPSSLPLEDRARLLKTYCAKRAGTPEPLLSFDRLTLQRLVEPALSDVVRSLHKCHGCKSEVEEFLLHAIEFGLLKDLADIAHAATIKTGQSCSKRLAAMRALTAVGTDAQINSAVQILSKDPALVERSVLADFITTFGARHLPCDLVMNLIERVGAGKRYSSDGLHQAMQIYVRGCSVEDSHTIVLRIGQNLTKEPHIERRYCPVSKDNAWMLNIGIPACERLVENRGSLALLKPSLGIIYAAGLARTYDDWRSSPQLDADIPVWRDLNNALFWYGIEMGRWFRQQDDESRVTQWQYAWAWVQHRQWRFSIDNIEDVLAWIVDKPLQDDKMVALNLAFDIYCDANRPRALRKRLWASVNGNTELSDHLKRRLNPPPMTDEEKRFRRSEANDKRRHKAHEKADAANRARWRELVSENLDQVRDLPPPSGGLAWNIQMYLFECMREHNPDTNTWSQTNWQCLAEEFGQEVAEAMRDELKAIWRRHDPTLVSESGKKENFCPIIQVMGLSGLEIESRETPGWPAALTSEEARRAARYLFCELNGFPTWFKRFADHHPALTRDAVTREAEWEMFEAPSEEPLHYVLSDLAWHAPWYAEQLAPRFLECLQGRDPVCVEALETALSAILRCEGIPDRDVAALCSSKVEATATPEAQIHLWYAAWVSADPDPAIEHLAAALASLSHERATELAIGFINALNNSRQDNGIDVRQQHMTARHLLVLHKLMHEHIRPADDINREAGRAYSPTARDHAQRARNHIIHALRDIPGKATFDALRTIAREAPNEYARAWLTEQAHLRAQADADRPWSVSRVNEFAAQLECTPSTPRELFDIAVNRLLDLKHEYEDGDFSPAEVVIRTEDETQIRNYLAGNLQQRSQGRYSISQEDEMPNKQRTDIRFMHAAVPGMVPVELKIADNWSGKVLFEKLRDQLCGDYLRDQNNKNGIFLLLSRGERQSWRIPDGNQVGFEDLIEALRAYGVELLATCDEFKGTIDNIQIVGIDLTKRSEVRQK
ncbi:MAG: hypothetical protein OXC91_07335 [Rhodobacteraceae bacterium]|nr:hypothetical protein [Paracoccaceae bacterium]